MKRLLSVMAALLFLVHIAGEAAAQSPSFADNFTDQTLRLDYIFAGDAKSQAIFLDQLSVSPRWYGKRHRLAEVPVAGNGQIVMRDRKSGEVIYKNSFSSLFHEWQGTPEATSVRRSFENVFLAPMPKRPADVTVTLFNTRHQPVAELTHPVDPADILIRHIGRSPHIPVQTIMSPQDTTRCINIAFVAEGFTEAEMPHFIEKVREATEAVFSYSPFKEARSRFNVVAVMPTSLESGPSEPGKGVWRNTALGSHFDTFYSPRYLTTLHQKALHDALAGVPYEHIIVLVNTPQYGGGGILNAYNLTMTDNKFFCEIVVHEFGHSFAGLADEYAYDSEEMDLYPLDVEPWEKNITTKVDFASKWEGMVGQKGLKGETIGLYEGAGYKLKGVFRPTPSCRMRDNTYPEFCPVCQAALNEVIDFYTVY
ncbi:MAG: IgA Peptidase M64 [Bacteroidales bacterium]|nr:IgA Peptidase M64 [Bacteroidales bacterium]